MRGPSLCYACACRILPLCHPHLDFLVVEKLLDLVLDLLLGDNPSLIGQELHSCPPHIAYVALVAELVGEVRPAQERHAMPEPFHCRVPPTMRHEAGDRRVREHALLRSPADDHPLADYTAPELLQPSLADAVGEVLPDHPQEWPAGEHHPVGELLDPRHVEDGEAPERHVDDGASFLLVEPRQARLVLRPEMAG
uniref:Uncharacterized protein n=1 Tax=Oryza brachyantha TaxID=4533 RepID=J3LSZ5_ORYBR